MTDQQAFLRQVSNCLVRRLLTEAEGDRRDWALGMAAEVEAIEADWAAVWFALGCWWSLCGVCFLGRILTPALGVCLLGWAGVKLYLALWVTGSAEDVAYFPDWLASMAWIACGGYALGGLCVLGGRHGLAAAALGSVMLVNASLYAVGLWSGPSPNTFMIALAFEDYVIWSLALFGLGGAYWLRHIEEVYA